MKKALFPNRKSKAFFILYFYLNTLSLLKISKKMTANAFLEEKKVFYVPKQLVHEELNGRKMYRRGYKNVLNQTKKIEEIMGCSSLQGIIISIF